jgi:AraC family transcriptional regulator
VEIRVIDCPAVTLIGWRHVGPYGPEVAHWWIMEAAPRIEQLGLQRARRFGLCHDDPQQTMPQACRYDACVEVPADFTAGGAGTITHLAAARYAIASYRGPAQGLGRAWSDFGQALRDRGLTPAFGPWIERYEPPALSADDASRIGCELCIPIGSLHR